MTRAPDRTTIGKVPTEAYWCESVTTQDAGRLTARSTVHVDRSRAAEPSPHVTETAAAREAPRATTVEVVSWSRRGDGSPATDATGTGGRLVDSAADADGATPNSTMVVATEVATTIRARCLMSYRLGIRADIAPHPAARAGTTTSHDPDGPVATKISAPRPLGRNVRHFASAVWRESSDESSSLAARLLGDG